MYKQKEYSYIQLYIRLLISTILAFFLCVCTLYAQEFSSDSIQKVQPSQIRTVEDLDGLTPYDLRNPSNLKTDFVYDEKTNLYFLLTTLNGKKLGTPIPFTPKEYLEYISKKHQFEYFLLKTEDKPTEKNTVTKAFNPFDIHFDIGSASKIFGPGGIRLRSQGSAEIIMGYKRNTTANPSISERARTHNYFDFNENIQASVQASIGDKLNFNMNYNTASTFDFDAKKLKLSFDGKEDDIIKLIEAGNVSINPRNSLINGGQTLFGIHSKMQFGKLSIDMIASQQKGESRHIKTQGSSQKTQFEIEASKYDSERHFFLSYYFRDNYNNALKNLPYISSPIRITKIEVWVTNINASFDNAKNILAFTDLAEVNTISNSHITSNNQSFPNNNANSLYQYLQQYPEIRTGNNIQQTLANNLSLGQDYEKIESARLLSPNEYSLNASLGYISLSTRLQNNQILAVAYEYISNGITYKVGEFSSDRPNATNESLIVKLIRGSNLSPSSNYWGLMMKNAYSLGYGISNVQPDGFRLNILYRNDASGVYSTYLPDGPIKGKPLIKILGLDNIDSHQKRNSDGIFDFVEGATIDSKNGVIFFPTIEPFGKTLSEAINDKVWEDKYAYQSLYNTTITAATQDAEKNKYLIRGEYKANNSGQISLGSVNVTQGSVKVSAAGQLLKENIDYTVDYLSGTVTITNQQILNNNTPIEVSLENTSQYSLQRKTLVGVDLNYQLNKNLNIGATVMHLSEMPLTNKTTYGSEALQNTIWGTNVEFHNDGRWLTNLLTYIPFLKVTQPSNITISGEFAHIIPGHYTDRYSSGYSYIDDFESSQSDIDLMNSYQWSLSSIPKDNTSSEPLFPEANLTNDIRSGNHRALLSWFTIDPLFNMDQNTLTPAYIRNNPDYVSNDFVRQINTSEIFPYKDININQRSYLSTLNVCFYPNERGPYNLSDDINSKGYLLHPEKNWGGIMRSIDQSDFEATGIEYIEFWLMDPFVNQPTAKGGNLYINLGDVSEDIINDGTLFYENGLPLTNDNSATKDSQWGKMTIRPPLGYAFDNSEGARSRQDVGLNGLSTEQEKIYQTYTDYINKIKLKVDEQTLSEWQQDPFSPINDPAGDNFHHYRGQDYDNLRMPILERYKRYNGTEGNSAEASSSSDNAYSIASTLSPDIEDINKDSNLETNESYYQYRISLSPNSLHVGSNYIVGKKTSSITMRNGQISNVSWYQFRIPIREFSSVIGGISDFRSIRYMRLFLTGFEEKVYLRFGSLKLIRGDWRVYNRSLYPTNTPPSTNASMSITTVGIEENGDRTPINYILPPGISRQLDASQTQSIQQNEQSLSLKIKQLSPEDARAVYKNVHYDMRRYKHLQLFSHAEQLIDDDTNTQNDNIHLFIRIGSDYLNNYYEYSIPLKLTPYGKYNNVNSKDREAVWPLDNVLNIDLSTLTKIKQERNRLVNMGAADVNYYKSFTRQDPQNPKASINIIGNPVLSDITSIMIGVRNNSQQVKSIEVWVNELRLGDYTEDNGWAANTNMVVQLSDIGNIGIKGQYFSAGFGSIDQSLNERRIDNARNISMSTNVDIGKLLPEKAKLHIPMYYSISNDLISPQYSPTNQDILLKDMLNEATNTHQRDSIKELSTIHKSINAFSISNARVDIKSRTPMPYDPANLSFSYSQSISKETTPDIEYSNKENWQLGASYDYTPTFRPIRPFKKLKGNDVFSSFLRKYNISLWPNNLRLQSNIIRNYEEEQLRNYTHGDDTPNIPATFTQQFLWNRRVVFDWNLTSRLKFSFDNTTNARIEEPYIQVNKRLDPDGYSRWRDSVMKSIEDLGTPIRYTQTATINYTLPTQDIDYLNWITGQSTYSSNYQWTMGAVAPESSAAAWNNLNNQMNFNFTGKINIRALFGKSKFFSDLMRRVESDNTKSINPRDINNKKKKNTTPSAFSSILDKIIYSVILLKEVNVSYRIDNSTIIPGFVPQIGPVIGQGNTSMGYAPGWDFAFGINDIDIVDRMAKKGWLSNNNDNLSPATFSSSSSLDMQTTITPIKDLNITINSNHSRIRRIDENFMFASRPRQYSGSFVMSTIGISGMFDFARGHNGYSSNIFNKFLSLRHDIMTYQQKKLYGQKILIYPTSNNNTPTTFFASSENTSLDINSPAVLIPAFMQSYTSIGKTYDPMPGILSALPNWSINYIGLNNISWLKNYFRAITLKHAYTGTYRVDNYNSFSSWAGNNIDEVGIIPSSNQDNNSAIASLAYDINSVSLQESFAPLMGIDVTMNNGLSSNISWRKNRGIVLNLSSFQLIESYSDEFSVGANYRIVDIASLWRKKTVNTKKRTRQKKEVINPKGLTIRFNYSYRRSLALIRKIQDNYTQATQGNIDHRISISADYDLSKMITLRAFFDWDDNFPLISSSSFPINNTNFGISFRLNLTQ